MIKPTDAPQDYRLFGLKVRSELNLPELLPDRSHDLPDVCVRVGSIVGPVRPFGIEPDAGGLLFTVPDVARYRIAGGSDILIDMAPDVPERNVRLYLLGSAFGALLHQRGSLTLHANAIEVDGDAIAFMGASGAGKSTLAAWFHDRGHRVIADDICVVGFGADGSARVVPGLPRLRLWKEALEASGRDIADYDRAWDGAEEWDKFEVPLSEELIAHGERRLAAVYLLKSADQLTLKPLMGARAAQSLIENTYRGRTIVAAGDRRSHWQSCLRVAEHVPVFEFGRPWGLSRLDKDMHEMLSHAGSIIAVARSCISHSEVQR